MFQAHCAIRRQTTVSEVDSCGDRNHSKLLCLPVGVQACVQAHTHTHTHTHTHRERERERERGRGGVRYSGIGNAP